MKLLITSCLMLMFITENEHYKIGISVWTGYPQNVKGFKDALNRAGLIEGENVTFIYGKSDGNFEKQKKIIEQFKEEQLDLVYSLTTPGNAMLKKNMPETMPIVFSIVTYPADSGLIDSFEYSGNNLVGTSNYVPFNDYIKVLKQTLPNVKTVAIVHRYGEPNSKIQAANLIRLLKRQGVSTIDLEPKTIDEMKTMALSVLDQVDAFMTTTDTLMQSGGEKALIEISLANHKPIISSNKAGIVAGASFGPVTDFFKLGEISGEMAIKILVDDVDPAHLETRLGTPSFLFNMESCKKLKIQPPKSLPNITYVETP